jgi:hypothetical protein
MKALKISIIIILTAIFFQCPYSSTVPIDKPNMSIDKKLLGKRKKYASDKNYIEIKKKSSNLFNIVQYTYDTTKKKYNKALFTGHLSKIGKLLFLNVKDDKGKYFFYKLEMSGNKVKAHAVTSNITEIFSSSKSLKKFFSKHKKLSFFYNKQPESFTKTK